MFMFSQPTERRLEVREGMERRVGGRKKRQLQLPIIIILIKQSLNRKSNYCGGDRRTGGGPVGLY